MAGENTTLKETLREVVGETVETPSANKANPEGVSESQSGETQSGGTPEYVAGVDISDIPEQDRPRFKQKLEAKLSLLEKGFQPKFQEVAALKKSLEWLASKGITAEKAEKLIVSGLEAEQNPNATDKQKKDKRTLDRLIDESPGEHRAALENLRSAIREESGFEKMDALEKKISELEKVLGFYSNSAVGIKKKELSGELDGLSDKLGKDFINKYREKIIDVALKNPDVPLLKILKVETPDDEYEQAFLSNRKSRTKEKAEAVTSAGTGVTSSGDVVDTKLPWKSFMRQINKK